MEMTEICVTIQIRKLRSRNFLWFCFFFCLFCFEVCEQIIKCGHTNAVNSGYNF